MRKEFAQPLQQGRDVDGFRFQVAATGEGQ